MPAAPLFDCYTGLLLAESDSSLDKGKASSSRRGKASSLRSPSSSRKNKAARAAGADRASGKKANDAACAAGAARASADDPAHDLNDDYCTVCKGAAIDDEPKEPLYCCDTCSRSFHAFCIKDLYAPNWTADDLPSSWHCHFCTGGDKQADDDACAAGAARASGKQAEDAAGTFPPLYYIFFTPSL